MRVRGVHVVGPQGRRGGRRARGDGETWGTRGVGPAGKPHLVASQTAVRLPPELRHLVKGSDGHTHGGPPHLNDWSLKLRDGITNTAKLYAKTG